MIWEVLPSLRFSSFAYGSNKRWRALRDSVEGVMVVRGDRAGEGRLSHALYAPVIFLYLGLFMLYPLKRCIFKQMHSTRRKFNLAQVIGPSQEFGERGKMAIYF